MILARDDIEKAVSWWAGKLLDHQPHSNGDDSFTSVTACFLADMAQQDITLDQVNAFKAALTKSIEISIHALREEGDSKNRDKISIFKQIIQHSARI